MKKFEETIQRYENSDFAPIIRHTATTITIGTDGTERRSSRRSVSPDANATHAEYCKALVLALARYGNLMELPYTIRGISSVEFADADAAYWYCALTNDNPPGKVSFNCGKAGYPHFRELVVPIDFRVYDEAKANEIRAIYTASQARPRAEVDADLIIQGELGELDGVP